MVSFPLVSVMVGAGTGFTLTVYTNSLAPVEQPDVLVTITLYSLIGANGSCVIVVTSVAITAPLYVQT